MPTLPLSLIVSLILIYILMRAIIRREAPWPIRTVIGLCALQGIILSGQAHYGLSWLLSLQPVTAAFIPPACYLAFLSLARRPLALHRDSWHLIGPSFTLFCVNFTPALLDLLIPALFSVYAVAILATLKQGPDAALLNRFESTGLSVRIWRILACFLLISAASDLLIGYDLTFGGGTHTNFILGISNALSLLALGLATLSRGADHIPPNQPGMQEKTANPENIALITRLTCLMEDKQPYLDPDLTLAKLARRLTVPAKNLSSAINQLEGKNVSQFVNEYRIRYACNLLGNNGCNVTDAMLRSGFQTKSNFNREFRRIMRQNPSEWMAALHTQ